MAGVGVITLAAFVLLMVLLVGRLNAGPGRVESYKDASGSAGLAATIAYDCPAPCKEKFDFNVYFFTKDGQQASVVRPDRDGKVHMALPQGDYIMLIGKQLGRDAAFPQEPLALKNGKVLELKLDYKGGRR